MNKKFVASLALMFAAISAHADNAGPSFDCAKASTQAEMMICSDPDLASLDAQLSIAFKTAQPSAANYVAFKRAQIDWLKNVRNACQDVACLKTAYQQRLAALTGQPQPANQPALAANVPANDGQAKKSPEPMQSTSTAPEPTANLEPVAASNQQSASAQESSSVKAVAEPKTANPIAPPAEAAATNPDLPPVPSGHKESPIPGIIFVTLTVFIIILVKVKNAPLRGQWFKMKKVGGMDLHGNQVHDDLILYDSEDSLLHTTKAALDDIPCPQCGNHKLQGDVKINYGPVQLFHEVRTDKGYKNESSGKKWLFYGANTEADGQVRCPDCGWKRQHGGFGDFGEKAAMVAGASIAAYALWYKSNEKKKTQQR